MAHGSRPDSLYCEPGAKINSVGSRLVSRLAASPVSEPVEIFYIKKIKKKTNISETVRPIAKITYFLLIPKGFVQSGTPNSAVIIFVEF